jgi:Arc/MetJ family transcription regulator
MRTNIIINDQLMESALSSGNYKSKREAVEEGLKLLVNHNSQIKLLELEGKIQWNGNLEEMRMD